MREGGVEGGDGAASGHESVAEREGLRGMKEVVVEGVAELGGGEVKEGMSAGEDGGGAGEESGDGEAFEAAATETAGGTGEATVEVEEGVGGPRLKVGEVEAILAVEGEHSVAAMAVEVEEAEVGVVEEGEGEWARGMVLVRGLGMPGRLEAESILEVEGGGLCGG